MKSIEEAASLVRARFPIGDTSTLGLDIIELRSVDHMLQNIPSKARMPYLAVTKLFPGWKDSWLLVARKKKGWKPRRALSAAEAANVRPDLHW